MSLTQSRPMTILSLWKQLFCTPFHSQYPHPFKDCKYMWEAPNMCAFKCWSQHRYMIQLQCCKMMCGYTEMPYYLRRYFSVCKQGASSTQKHNHALSFLLCISTAFAGETLFSTVMSVLEVISLHTFRHFKKPTTPITIQSVVFHDH